jgi:hypothetical protein
MFAIPIWGFRGRRTRDLRAPIWLRACALSGFLMTLLFVVLSILPIVQVESRLVFALKISSVIVLTNVIGYAVFVRAHRRL